MLMKKRRNHGMKKALYLALILIVSCAVVFSGCSGGGSAPAGDASSDGAAEEDVSAGAADEVYTLKINVHTPEVTPPSVSTKAGADMATELSGGRLQFEIYYSGNMVAYLDTFMGLSDKVIDMAMVDGTMIAGGFTLNQIFSKPLKTTPPERLTTSKAYREFLANNPVLNEEFLKVGVRWLSVGALAGYNIHMKNKDVKTPGDLQGMKLDSLGDAVTYFTAIGAAATAMDPGETYSALEKNLIDGQVTHWALMNSFATQDFLKYHTIFGELGENGDGGLYAPCIGYVINDEVWNGLPADLQQILVESFDFAGDEMARGDIALIEEAKQIATDRGDTFSYVTGADLDPWYEWMDKSNADWFAACEAAGYDGEGLYNAMLEVLGEYAP
jgi:TRAP-type C4-dicarboxylate transport system substrate-binding protein